MQDVWCPQFSCFPFFFFFSNGILVVGIPIQECCPKNCVFSYAVNGSCEEVSQCTIKDGWLKVFLRLMATGWICQWLMVIGRICPSFSTHDDGDLVGRRFLMVIGWKCDCWTVICSRGQNSMMIIGQMCHCMKVIGWRGQRVVVIGWCHCLMIDWKRRSMLGSVWVSMPEDWLNVTVPSMVVKGTQETICLLYTSPSPRD